MRNHACLPWTCLARLHPRCARFAPCLRLLNICFCPERSCGIPGSLYLRAQTRTLPGRFSRRVPIRLLPDLSGGGRLAGQAKHRGTCPPSADAHLVPGSKERQSAHRLRRLSRPERKRVGAHRRQGKYRGPRSAEKGVWRRGHRKDLGCEGCLACSGSILYFFRMRHTFTTTSQMRMPRAGRRIWQ